MECAGGVTVTVTGYREIVRVSGSDATLVLTAPGCEAITRGVAITERADGLTLSYDQAVTACSPGPSCAGEARAAITGGQSLTIPLSCAAGPSLNPDTGGYKLTSDGSIRAPVPTNANCESVYERVAE
jgi:hypothetical protein